jgi:hypothetical protein
MTANTPKALSFHTTSYLVVKDMVRVCVFELEGTPKQPAALCHAWVGEGAIRSLKDRNPLSLHVSFQSSVRLPSYGCRTRAGL